MGYPWELDIACVREYTYNHRIHYTPNIQWGLPPFVAFYQPKL